MPKRYLMYVEELYNGEVMYRWRVSPAFGVEWLWRLVLRFGIQFIGR